MNQLFRPVPLLKLMALLPCRRQFLQRGRFGISLFETDGQGIGLEVFRLLVVESPQNGPSRGHFRVEGFFRGVVARLVRRHVNGLVPVQGEGGGSLPHVLPVDAQAGPGRNAAYCLLYTSDAADD